MSSWGAGGKDKDGYVRDFEKGGEGMLFDIGADEDDEDEKAEEAVVTNEKRESTATTATSRCKHARLTPRLVIAD